MMFVDPTHGWSHDGTQRTTDGGQTWTWAHVPGPSTATFVSPTEGWAGGSEWNSDNCYVYIDHTTDGGGSWSRRYTSDLSWYSCDLGTIHFVDNLYGWAFGSTWYGGPFAFKTTDGGATWESARTEFGAGERRWLKMLDRTTWFRLTAEGGWECYPYDRTYKLSKTTDAGSTWLGAGTYRAGRARMRAPLTSRRTAN